MGFFVEKGAGSYDSCLCGLMGGWSGHLYVCVVGDGGGDIRVRPSCYTLLSFSANHGMALSTWRYMSGNCSYIIPISDHRFYYSSPPTRKPKEQHAPNS